MDGRSVLARWLSRRRRAWAQAPAHDATRSPNGLTRWLARLFAIDVPRGAGAAAAALLLLASVSYGVIRGNHAAEIAAGIQDLCDAAANAAGFGITEIALSGEHEVSRAEILSRAGITDRTSLLFLDAGRARTRLLANPWIADAAVLKLYPNRLRIEIRERKPFALWQDKGRVLLIAADGTVLTPSAPARYLALPLVVGEGAAQAAEALLAMLARYPVIAREVRASVLVAERRWTLYLKNGIEVLLPESEPEHALKTLVDLDRSRKLLSRDIVNVDLRLPDRVSVRLSEAAAAQRAQAVKATEKDRLKRGGDA
ncbi:MAG: FtsQ-type POTRA domain-containing protein [Pseudolabrys sp.]|nr:FtsQ-type POTRA domain-containing protein [Pseudolabrys sp.]